MNIRQLYLVRHAIAAKRGREWPDDRARPLTAKGIQRFTDVVRGLAALDLQLEVVLTSPLVRAKQTARLLASGLPGRTPVRILEPLSPGSDPRRVLLRLAHATTQHRVALVGHEPDLGRLAAYLIGTERALPFKKGGVCRIDVAGMGSDDEGTLVWFATPRILRALGGGPRRAK